MKETNFKTTIATIGTSKGIIIPYTVFRKEGFDPNKPVNVKLVQEA